MPMLRTMRAADEGDLAARARAAASRTCCTRCTCEANDATMMRPVAFAKIESSTGPDLPLRA